MVSIDCCCWSKSGWCLGLCLLPWSVRTGVLVDELIQRGCHNPSVFLQPLFLYVFHTKGWCQLRSRMVSLLPLHRPMGGEGLIYACAIMKKAISQ